MLVPKIKKWKNLWKLMSKRASVRQLRLYFNPRIQDLLCSLEIDLSVNNSTLLRGVDS